jgi:hypothetical protein
MSPLPSGAHGLSLQERLDRISQERAVLDILRELARQGFHDGDRLSSRTLGTFGRLVVVRSSEAPFAAVSLDDGSRIRFLAQEWVRQPP